MWTVCLLCLPGLIASMDNVSQLAVINPHSPSISCTLWCSMWSTSMTSWSLERIRSSPTTLSIWRRGWRAASHSTQDALGKWNRNVFCSGLLTMGVHTKYPTKFIRLYKHQIKQLFMQHYPIIKAIGEPAALVKGYRNLNTTEYLNRV